MSSRAVARPNWIAAPGGNRQVTEKIPEVGIVVVAPKSAAFHLIVVTNIDNFLRPILVPRDARLNSALMLLAVFAGIGMFGFWGIVIGPVLMIIIVTTIDVYLAVYHGVPMDSHDEEPGEPKPGRKWLPLPLRR